MTDLTALTLAQARDGLRSKEFSATELAESHLAAIESARALNAFVLETPERALDMARASDAQIAKVQGGPLEGLPLGIKDLFCTDGVRTTACSHILENFVPPYESTVPPHLWRAHPRAGACCRIVGLKPTYGRCSRWGIVAFASSLDQAGPFARSVRDCAILLRSMAGADPKDTTGLHLPGPD